jgi:Fic family protein
MLRDLVLDWETFVNQDNDLPLLVQCALMHYQFEAIHPYLDGNGRIGRLLITLFLCAQNILPLPLLYLSAYFERTKQEYYQRLFQVSETGDWNSWLSYFLTGVAEQANDALLRARQVRMLHERMIGTLHDNHESANALRMLDELFQGPVMSVSHAAKLLDVSINGARGILDRLAGLGIVQIDAQRWPRVYIIQELLDVVDATTAE